MSQLHLILLLLYFSIHFALSCKNSASCCRLFFSLPKINTNHLPQSLANTLTFFPHLPCQANCCHIILSHYLRQHQAPWPQFTWHISTTPKWFFSRRHSSLPYVLNIFKGIHAQKMIKDSLPTCPAASGGQSCTAGTVRSTLSGPRWSHSSTEGGGPACKCWHLFPRPLLHQSTD